MTRIKCRVDYNFKRFRRILTKMKKAVYPVQDKNLRTGEKDWRSLHNRPDGSSQNLQTRSFPQYPNSPPERESLKQCNQEDILDEDIYLSDSYDDDIFHFNHSSQENLASSSLFLDNPRMHDGNNFPNVNTSKVSMFNSHSQENPDQSYLFQKGFTNKLKCESSTPDRVNNCQNKACQPFSNGESELSTGNCKDHANPQLYHKNNHLISELAPDNVSCKEVNTQFSGHCIKELYCTNPLPLSPGNLSEQTREENVPEAKCTNASDCDQLNQRYRTSFFIRSNNQLVSKHRNEESSLQEETNPDRNFINKSNSWEYDMQEHDLIEQKSSDSINFQGNIQFKSIPDKCIPLSFVTTNNHISTGARNVSCHLPKANTKEEGKPYVTLPGFKSNPISSLSSQNSSQNNDLSDKFKLAPSTFIMKTYFKNKLPTKCFERNELYTSLIYAQNTALSDSYDNLSDTGSSSSIGGPTFSSPKEKNSSKLLLPPGKSSFRFSTSSSVRKRFRKNVPEYNLDKLFPKDLTQKVIDTHCHLDFLFQRENHKGTFSSYKDKNSFPSCFGGCVAIFCEPDFFVKKSNWENLLKEDDVWAAFGVHPHHANKFNSEIEQMLKDVMEHEKVVALGEIGLDYSSKNNCNRGIQKQIFAIQLKIAVERNMPIIIHCRDAQDDCLDILKTCVPLDAKIHRHCFTGTITEAQEWMAVFSNLFIGFTPLVTFGNASQVHTAASLIPVDRMLFETDAPYFVPAQAQGEMIVSHPGMVIHVAAQIAAIRGIEDFSDFLAKIRANTKKMYNF